MFRDTQKELERLEAELREDEEEYEEEWEDEEDDSLLDDDDDFGEDLPENYRNFSNRYKAYNSDRTDWDPDDLAEELEHKPRSGPWVLCAVALLLTAAVFLLLTWYYGGTL